MKEIWHTLFDRDNPYWQKPSKRFLHRALVSIVGFALLIVGFMMLFLPGPAFIFIPLALALLSTEYRWAKRIVSRAGKLWSAVKKKGKSFKQGGVADAPK